MTDRGPLPSFLIDMDGVLVHEEHAIPAPTAPSRRSRLPRPRSWCSRTTRSTPRGTWLRGWAGPGSAVARGDLDLGPGHGPVPRRPAAWRQCLRDPGSCRCLSTPSALGARPTPAAPPHRGNHPGCSGWGASPADCPAGRRSCRSRPVDRYDPLVTARVLGPCGPDGDQRGSESTSVPHVPWASSQSERAPAARSARSGSRISVTVSPSPTSGQAQTSVSRPCTGRGATQ